MSHLELEQQVSLEVVSTDVELLDSLESESPDADSPQVGAEYSGPTRRVVDDSEAERLTARVVFQTTYTEDQSVQQHAETYAENLYNSLTNYDLSQTESYQIRHYQSPTGGVTVNVVRDFYEKNPDLQPTDEDGEAYIPNSFNLEHHIVSEVTSSED